MIQRVRMYIGTMREKNNLMDTREQGLHSEEL
jgi:hypothetical protein